MTWKAGATKQAARVQKGKPPWAGPKQNQPKATTAPPTTTPTPPAAAPDSSKTPPGQDKVPPGQDKVPPGQAKKGQSPQG